MFKGLKTYISNLKFRFFIRPIFGNSDAQNFQQFECEYFQKEIFTLEKNLNIFLLI